MKLCKQHHPDRVPEAQRASAEVRLAQGGVASVSRDVWLFPVKAAVRDVIEGYQKGEKAARRDAEARVGAGCLVRGRVCQHRGGHRAIV